jgi:hypothetical protein
MDLEYCSPIAITHNNKICYTKNSLITIIKVWNYLLPLDKIIYDISQEPQELFDKINEKFKSYLNIDNTYWSWIDILKYIALKINKPNIINILKPIEKKDLRPSQPEEWVNNPIEWLSNFDIEKCLIQYENTPEYKYKFIGVFSIDFGIPKNPINLKNILSKYPNISFIGFITNLSRSNEPGTHWTSSFFVLNPSLKSYGGYYYDSTTGKIPNDLKPVFDDIKRQAEEIFKKPFNIQINNIRHQFSNTECGVFSIAFQTRWISILRKNGDADFNEIVKFEGYKDDIMKQLRNKLFRPNIKSLKIKSKK